MYKKITTLLIIVIILLLFGCMKDNKGPTDHIITNDNVSAFIITQGTTKLIYNYIDEKEETTTFDMYLNIFNPALEDKVIDYELKAYNVALNSLKFTSTKESLPLYNQLIYDNNISGNGFSEFFLKIIDGEDEYNFYEKAMELSPYDFDEYSEGFSSELIEISYNVSEDSEKHNVEFIINANANIHLDLQTFLVSKNKGIYSFLGLYGYQASQFPYNIERNYIYKEMEMSFMYIMANIYTLDGKKNEIKARIQLSEILN